jgi:hypothetical protein
MKDIKIHLDCDTPSTKEELVALFTRDVDDFSKWLETKPSTMQQGALTTPERVLLLTYLMQKYVGNIDKE